MTKTNKFLGQGIFLGLNIHQIFHLLNKKIQNISRDLSFNRRVTLKSFIRKNILINIAPEHCFDVTLADFEQIINNDFIQLEAQRLNDINYFSRESNRFGIIFG